MIYTHPLPVSRVCAPHDLNVINLQCMNQSCAHRNTDRRCPLEAERGLNEQTAHQHIADVHIHARLITGPRKHMLL